MLKLLTFPTIDDKGDYLKVLDPGEPLIKMAASDYSPETKNYISQIKPVDGKTFLLLNAMGDGEVWGSNRNGDYFPTKALDVCHKSFEDAHVFKHHANKDPGKGYGKVLFSSRNPRMHRVELIIVIDNDKAPDIVERIENGEHPDVSMGCKVPFDVCSYCGHKSKKVSEYCKHLKFQMNEILDGGKRVCAINTKPRFFDISFVFRGADRTGKTLAKVASDGGAVDILKEAPSAVIAEEVFGEDKVAEDSPVLDVIKEFGDKYTDLFDTYEVNINDEVLGKFASYPMDETLSTLAAHGIVLKPVEFFKLSLLKSGNKELAEKVASLNLDPYINSDSGLKEISGILDPRAYNAEIGKIASRYHEERSAFEPYLTRRVMRLINIPSVKTAQDKELLEQKVPHSFAKLLGVLGASFLAYRYLVPKSLFTKYDTWLTELSKKNPAVAVGLLGGTAGALRVGERALSGSGTHASLDMLEKNSVFGGYATRVFAPIAGTYLARAHITSKARAGEPISSLERTIATHPDTIAATLAGGLVLSKARRQILNKLKSKSASPKKSVFKRIFSGLKKTSGYTLESGKLPTPKELRKLAAIVGGDLAETLVFHVPIRDMD